jgi:hypothetical protein
VQVPPPLGRPHAKKNLGERQELSRPSPPTTMPRRSNSRVGFHLPVALSPEAGDGSNSEWNLVSDVLTEELERLESGQQTLGDQIDGTNVDDWVECLSNRRTATRCASSDSLEHGLGGLSARSVVESP